MEIFTIYKKMEISASHQIKSEGYQGKCANLHGHNYKVEVWISKAQVKIPSDNDVGYTYVITTTGEQTQIPSLDKHGMVLDFNEIKKVVNFLDHKHLNDIEGLEITPTAEKIAQWISNKIPFKNRVRVWETKDSYAEYWSE